MMQRFDSGVGTKGNRGNHFMIQYSRCAGPFNLGVHISIGDTKYIDIYLPYIVLTFGNIKNVEYPPYWWSCSRDSGTGGW